MKESKRVVPSFFMVSLVCVTKRKDYLNNIINNFTCQSYRNLELIIVLHGVDVEDDYYELCRNKAIKIIFIDCKLSFGHALNIGFLSSSGEYVFKFDDDDIYADRYVEESVDVFNRSSFVSVLGKSNIYWLLSEDGDFFIRRSMKNQLAGATIAMRRSLLKKTCFESLNIGEDSTFLQYCKQLSINCYSTSSENFCAVRYEVGHHTWDVTPALLKKATKNINIIEVATAMDEISVRDFLRSKNEVV